MGSEKNEQQKSIHSIIINGIAQFGRCQFEYGGKGKVLQLNGKMRLQTNGLHDAGK